MEQVLTQSLHALVVPLVDMLPIPFGTDYLLHVMLETFLTTPEGLFGLLRGVLPYIIQAY